MFVLIMIYVMQPKGRYATKGQTVVYLATCFLFGPLTCMFSETLSQCLRSETLCTRMLNRTGQQFQLVFKVHLSCSSGCGRSMFDACTIFFNVYVKNVTVLFECVDPRMPKTGRKGLFEYTCTEECFSDTLGHF